MQPKEDLKMYYNNSITQEENDYAHDLLEIMLMMEGYDTEQIDEFLEHADEHDLNEQIERIISTDYSEIIISEEIIDLLEEEGYITEGKGRFIKGLWQGGKNWFKNLFGKGKKVVPKPPKLTPEKVAPRTTPVNRPVNRPTGGKTKIDPKPKVSKTLTKTTTTKTPTKTTSKGNPLKTGATLALGAGLATLGLYGSGNIKQGSGQDSDSSNSGSNTNTNSSSSHSSGSGSGSDSNTRNQNRSGKSTMPSYLSAVNRGDSAEMERLAKGGKSYDTRDKNRKVYAVAEDCYNIVANYLLEMGHADTLDEINYIMLEMDSQTITEIVESAIEG